MAKVAENRVLDVLDSWTKNTGRPWSLHVSRDDETDTQYFAIHEGHGERDWSHGLMLQSCATTSTEARQLAANAIAELGGHSWEADEYGNDCLVVGWGIFYGRSKIEAMRTAGLDLT